ncbi:MAG: hypothetical protein QM426_04505 [Euryarchaeota archaeon]|nr:hypothetical protein [Euryarchaeota archaeon]
MYLEKMYDDSLSSGHEYSISIETKSTLKNVTLYLPVPVFENKSEIGMKMVSGDCYNKPSNLDLSLEDTEHGLMLKIEAAEIKPVYHSLPVTTEPGSKIIEDEVPKVGVESNEYSEKTPVLIPIKFETSVIANNLINTRFPVGNEAVLLPKNNLGTKDPISPPSERIKPAYFDYESLVYAHYDTSPDTEVYISVESGGGNAWGILEWHSNFYNDRISIRLLGPQEGWIQVEGKLITGEGIYRE